MITHQLKGSEKHRPNTQQRLLILGMSCYRNCKYRLWDEMMAFNIFQFRVAAVQTAEQESGVGISAQGKSEAMISKPWLLQVGKRTDVSFMPGKKHINLCWGSCKLLSLLAMQLLYPSLWKSPLSAPLLVCTESRKSCPHRTEVTDRNTKLCFVFWEFLFRLRQEEPRLAWNSVCSWGWPRTPDALLQSLKS